MLSQGIPPGLRTVTTRSNKEWSEKQVHGARSFWKISYLLKLRGFQNVLTLQQHCLGLLGAPTWSHFVLNTDCAHPTVSCLAAGLRSGPYTPISPGLQQASSCAFRSQGSNNPLALSKVVPVGPDITLVVLTLKRQRQENLKFKGSLGYTARLSQRRRKGIT